MIKGDNRRYAFKQLVGILLRHFAVVTIGLILVIVGSNLHNTVDSRVTRSVEVYLLLFFLFNSPSLHLFALPLLSPFASFFYYIFIH